MKNPRALPPPSRAVLPRAGSALASFAVSLSLSSLSFVAAPGCVTPAQNREDNFLRIAHEYNDGLRWQRTQQVTPHLPPEEAAAFLARLGTMPDDFQMADYEVTAIELQDHGQRAAVTVDFTWYNQTRSLVRHAVIAEDWRFRDGRWLCLKHMRVRGDRFPLVPEPLSPPTAPSP